ncbi:hypothetical protein PIB30_001332 [Stylosanthes scabra]|uniref:Glutamate receptor n=1 Tax=Stylosanthes scabra TaxID=79078 RepID=A0ABU6Y123_9FABA|nr:hypothetical protein [Stylosanthes scabra]
MSLSDFYDAHPHYNTRLLLNVRDSQNDVVTAASAAVELMKKEKVEAIMGPVTSMQASFVVNLGDKAHVPIISFTATSPSLTSLGSSYFFRIAQNDSSQVDAITDIIQSFSWRQAVPIYIDNDYGRAIIPFLTNSLQQANIRVPYLAVISPSATVDQIEEQLYKLMTMQTRVFVVHMLNNPGSTLFAIADRIGMMSQGYVWIVTNGMANTLASLDSSEMEAMQGVIGVKTYVPKSKRMVEFQARWKRRFLQENPTMVDANINVFGLWAYDATTALASAVERANNNNTKLGFENTTTNTSSNFSDMDNLGVSHSGEELRDALSDTRFSGLAGEFSLINGQLDATTFQIINVNGNGEKVIGYWTPQKGLTRNLSSSSSSGGGGLNNNNNNLGAMIWPGDSYSVPKGWEIPTNGKKLRIGVPVSSRPQFVNVELDSETNTTKVTGFSIDVFEAVVQDLPYALPYQLIPFAKSNGEMAGTYNDLIMQVFDAVVGDTTIIANRSKYVDFTLPYTESGVSMVVPVKDKSKKGAWVFLKPLTWDLWMTTGCSFVFFGFVVWVLEHRINKDFRGPPSHQIGTSLWFSFSTMVFAHREKVVSNTARFVVIIWVFVVLILTQSYTANLSSLLTVEQLRPTVTNVNDLIKYGTRVGYHRGSFIRGILLNLGFKDFQLITYNSTAQCDDLLSRGSQNGGIAAAFDEIPYIRILLGTYCSKYAMVDPTFKTDGFGFVFPRNSPMVADVSRAILKVTEDPRMKEIENAWFQNRSSCQEEDASVSSSNSLGLDSFWGLFLIAALPSISALLIFSATFLYDHRHQWWFINNNHDDNHLWKTRIRVLLRIFDQKDPRSHRFKRGSNNDSIKEEEDRENNDQSSSTIIGPHYHHHEHDHSLDAASSYTESSFSFQGSPCEDNNNNVELNNLNSSQPSQQEN